MVRLLPVLLLLLVVLPVLAQPDAGKDAPPTQGTVVGIVVARGEAWVSVKAEADKEPIRYIPFWRGGAPADGGGPDKDTLAALKKVYLSNLVEVSWQLQENQRRIVSITAIVPAEKTGAVTGTIVAKGENWLDLKPKAGPVERYMACWVGGMPKDGGGFDKEMLKTIAAVKVGDAVTLQWRYEERKRVLSVAPAPAEKPAEVKK
jgi:hypothetical protein